VTGLDWKIGQLVDIEGSQYTVISIEAVCGVSSLIFLDRPLECDVINGTPIEGKGMCSMNIEFTLDEMDSEKLYKAMNHE
jgi:hypothetical protein